MSWSTYRSTWRTWLGCGSVLGAAFLSVVMLEEIFWNRLLFLLGLLLGVCGTWLIFIDFGLSKHREVAALVEVGDDLLGMLNKSRDSDHVHYWEVAEVRGRKLSPIDFWICCQCGTVSPGPTDVEERDPRRRS